MFYVNCDPFWEVSGFLENLTQFHREWKNSLEGQELLELEELI